MRQLLLVPLLTIVLPLSVHAVAFTDVPQDSPHRSAIEELTDVGVITGFGDGTFRPTNPINRAGFLKMLYKSEKREPSEPQTICGTDVVAGAWYERYVCSALLQNYVHGYPDGTFHPDAPVTRAEAIKMALTVYEFDLSLDSLKNVSVPTYSDVTSGDWYWNYIVIASKEKLLPLPSWSATALSPNTPLTRAEAASLVSNVMHAKKRDVAVKELSTSSASSKAPTTSSASSTKTVSSVSANKSSTSSISAADREKAAADSKARLSSMTVVKTSLPLSDAKSFTDKQPFSYQFDVTNKQTISITAALPNSPGALSCRLYRLETSGISNEYYTGYEAGTTCYLLASLTAGKYQLQLQPTIAGVKFIVSSKVVKGDGNDNFADAKSLETNPVLVGTLEDGDLQDFYIFNVNTASAKSMTMSLASSVTLGCLIYPLGNVDIDGEKLPDCNQAYAYPAGTYVVGISRSSALALSQKLTYTVRLDK